jgi:hypothetical protein
MLLRDHVINALTHVQTGSALVIGDIVGEDKFRVLKLMRRLAREGIIHYLWDCPYECERVAADRLHFVSQEVMDSARLLE